MRNRQIRRGPDPDPHAGHIINNKEYTAMVRLFDDHVTVTHRNEKFTVGAWGRGLRVRGVPYGEFPAQDWALENRGDPKPAIWQENGSTFIENSGIRCEIFWENYLRFTDHDGNILLEEVVHPGQFRMGSRQYKTCFETDGFELNVDFRAYKGEHIHGMGQFRDGIYDLKGCTVELAQRNSQISVPFLVSSRGYGFLWNNPAIGRTTFAENVTKWHADSTNCLDYWICAGSTPDEIIRRYSDVVGKPSPLPESLLGLWQCKLRYRTQDEVLEVAREYRRRGIRLDVIVIDFFHWERLGDYDFDRKYWPDPKAMVDELKSMGIRVMVSVWPTVVPESRNFRDFDDNGYLVRFNRNYPVALDFIGQSRFVDSTNPAAREFLYSVLKRTYGSYGIDMFWLDEAEPEYSLYEFDNYRYYIGNDMQTGNIFPRYHSLMAYEGLKKDGTEDILNLVRCAWVGSQKYGALVWSGDIECTFNSLKTQIRNGINMGVAGIPWWTSDIGGFYGGNINDPAFRELLVRWYQWAVYTPVLRMHGDRAPSLGADTPGINYGGGCCHSGSPNEIWSYGDEVYGILRKYLDIRYDLKPYIVKTKEESEKTGLPMIRGMFIAYPEDENCWAVDDQYMFGTDYLVAPVTELGARTRNVYLPKGRWESLFDGSVIDSDGTYVEARAPLEYMPVFRRI